VFVTGACVLVIEIIGTRLLSPFFGSGIYTWSTLISVTLAALALGYWFGGHLADRRPDSRLLYALCLLAGCWTVLTPQLARLILPVLFVVEELRLAVLVAGMALFFPNLFLLGAIGPFAIRLITQHPSFIGTSSGRIFAVSTVGSLLAALTTGFVLIPQFGVQTIFLGTGSVLVLLAMANLRDIRWLAASAVLLLGTALLASQYWIDKRAEPKAGVKVIAHLPSFYAELHVLRTDDFLMLLADGIGQNYVRRDSRRTVPYLTFLAEVPALTGILLDGSRSALVIGLGAGQLPMLLEKAGLRTTAVEIDPNVGLLARRHFGFDLAEDQVHYMDGRQFLARTREQFDYIVLDAFTGEQIPWHLISREALLQVRDSLHPGGVLGMNITSTRGGKDLATIQRTLQDVFTHVRVFMDPRGDQLFSFEFLASVKPLDLATDSREREDSFTEMSLGSFLDHELPDLGGTLVLTDDYNPINEWRRKVDQLWRKEMHGGIGRENLHILF